MDASTSTTTNTKTKSNGNGNSNGEAAADLDLTVFIDDVDGECATGSNFESCLSMKRLLVALRYFSALDVVHNHNDGELFQSFLFTVYRKSHFVNDYIHLSVKHQAQLEHIRAYFIAQSKQSKLCTLTPTQSQSEHACKFTARHQEIEHDENKQSERDARFAQFCDMFDALHFYILHLFDAGMRRTKQDRKPETPETDELDQARFVDAEFSRLTRWVSDRQHATASFDRFASGTNSKFEIQTMQNSLSSSAKAGNQTYLDFVCQQLQQSKVSETAIERFRAWVSDQDYDTDSVEADVLSEQPQGNIARALQNQPHCFSVIRNMFQSAKDSASSFAAGYRFYYWPHFKNQTEKQDRNHPEYTVSQLYVAQKYSSFKEEIANYRASKFDLTKYNNKVRVKALELLTSNIVKQTKPTTYLGSLDDGKAYGISQRNGRLRFQHLVSLSMYCDFTHLSSKFTATFRKSHPFEQFYQIKRRNSAFWWFAKSLRETVEIFGKSYAQTQFDEFPFEGPFYCGMSFVMTMPQFSIRLNGPTSTTMYEEVALKFSGPNGVIITLNNKTKYGGAQFVTGFNCSWLSRYREEDERLFFGGYAPINIESINIIKTKQNFQDIICGLCYLDKLLSGQDTDGDKISEHQVAIFAAIYGSFCGDSATQVELDAYIEQTLQQFVQNKTHITLDLYYLAEYGNKEMVKLIMNEMEENEDKAIRSKEDQTNLPRAALLNTFKNVKEIIINTYDWSISFLWFLELITGSSITKAVIYDGDCWLDKLWSNEKEREEIVSAYKQQNYQLQYVKEEEQCVASKIM